MADQRISGQKLSTIFELMLDFIALVAAVDGLLAPFTKISTPSAHDSPPFGIASCSQGHASECNSIHNFNHLVATLKENETKLAYFVVSLVFVAFRGVVKGTASLIKLGEAGAAQRQERATSRDEYWGLARATARFGLLACMYDLCQYEARVWAEGLFGPTGYVLTWGPALHVLLAAGVPCLLGLLAKAAAVVDVQMEEKGMKGEGSGHLKGE